jgi:sirohydrochlorin ferrochelatase
MTTGTRDLRMPVVLLAHGSRHLQGTASIERLRDAVAAASGLEVRVAYLDLNEPDLSAAAGRLRADGYDRAVVVPLLFTPAFHARSDAPEAVAAARAATGLELRTADILGTGEDVLTLLLEAVDDAGIPATGELIVASVGSSRPEANAQVARLGDRLAARRGAPVRTAYATCEPRVADALTVHPDTAGVAALFVGRGRLLDSIVGLAGERGIPVTAPLEAVLAPLVLQRYDAAT